MNKKICFVSTISATIKSFIIPIAYELVKSGADVTLICSDDADMFHLADEYGFKYHPIHMGRGINFSGIKSTACLFRYIRKEKFDMVQYCTPNAAFYASIAAKLAKVKVRLYCQWGIRYVGLKGISRRIFKLIEYIVCMCSTDIRVASWKNMDFAVLEGLYKKHKAKVVGNGGTIGVNLSLFDIEKKDEYNKFIRSKYGIFEHTFLFGFCGRLSKDKGEYELLTAFKDISQMNFDIKLLIIGEIKSDNTDDSQILNWAKNSDDVIFTGKIPEDEMYFYYAPIDVLVHPTYREGFGMVIQEAGAYGIPCITTNIPGASEVMEDGKSCILVDAKNAESLKNAMILLLSNRTLLEKLGKQAYIRTKNLYDRFVMLDYQKEDYLALLGKTE